MELGDSAAASSSYSATKPLPPLPPLPPATTPLPAADHHNHDNDDMATATSDERSSHRSRNRVCKRCKYTTADAKEFLHHQISAHAETLEVHACDKCEFVADSHAELACHRLSHRHAAGIALSKQSTDSEHELMEEARDLISEDLEEGNNNYKVSNHAMGSKSLGERSDGNANSYQLASHNRSPYTSNGLQQQSEDLFCHECGDIASNIREHLLHLKEAHNPDLQMFLCDACEFATQNDEDLLQHIDEFHSNITGIASLSPTATGMAPRDRTHVKPTTGYSSESYKFANGSRSNGRSDGGQKDGEAEAEVEEEEGSGAKKLSYMVVKNPDYELKAGEDSYANSDNDSGPRLAGYDGDDDCGFSSGEDHLVMDEERMDHEPPPDSHSKPPPGNSQPTGLRLPVQITSTQSSEILVGHKGLGPGRDVKPAQLQQFWGGGIAGVGKNRLSTLSGTGHKVPATVSMPRTAGSAVLNTGSTPPKPKGCAPVREAVDPAKYVTLQEPDGIKYACSKCGNIYKWRKSLNKHWKEKHDGEIPDPRMKNFTALNIPRIRAGMIDPSVETSGKRGGFMFNPSAAAAGGGGGSAPGSRSGLASLGLSSGKGIPESASQKAPALRRALKRPVVPEAGFTLHSGFPASSSSGGTVSVSAPRPLPHPSHEGNLAHMPRGGRQLTFKRDQNTATSADRGYQVHKGVPGSAFSVPTKYPSSPSHPRLPKAGGTATRPPASPVNLTKQQQRLAFDAADSEEGILDLSRRGSPSKPVVTKASPPQDEPLDFSMKPTLGGLSPRPASSKRSAAEDYDVKREPKGEDTLSDIKTLFSSTGGESGTKLEVPELIGSLNLQCPSCAYAARNKQDYDEHMELHLRKRHYKCAECQQVFFTINELNQHFSSQHINILKPNAHTTATAVAAAGGSPGNLLRATQTIIRDNNLGDNLNSKNIPESQLFKYLTMDSTNQLLTCVVCGAIFQWKWTLEKHFAQDHSSLPNPYIKKRASGGGGSGASASSSLASIAQGEPAIKKSRLGEPGAAVSGSLKCHQCDFVAVSSSELARHQLKHSIHRQYGCSLCSFTTKWKDQILNHYRQSHPSSIVDLEQVTSNDMDAMERTAAVAGMDEEGTAIVIPQAPEETQHQEKMMEANRNRNLITGRSRSKLSNNNTSSAETLLPFKCTECEYRARWPSEISQHMKNHSDEKPYLCPRCSYRSKWKWDVVKHLKRCGGGTVKDVIDTTKQRKQQHVKAMLADVLPCSHSPGFGPMSASGRSLTSPGLSREVLSNGPPNVTVVATNPEMVEVGSLDLSSSKSSRASEDDMAYDQCDPGLDHDDLMESLQKDGSPGKSFPGYRGGMGGVAANQIMQHYCNQCPFVGNSPAELKRHSRVHSDEKPFICKTCGYCSKWKCDLKKHLKTYNHTSAVPLAYGGHGRKPSDWNQNGSGSNSPSPGSTINDDEMRAAEEEDDEEEEKMMKEEEEEEERLIREVDEYNETHRAASPPPLYQCDKCPYATYKRNVLDSHAKIHRQSGDQGGKLKCKQCEYEAGDLPSFLQHKLTHFSQQNATDNTPTSRPVMPQETSAETLPGIASSPPSSRHRRKPLRQYRIFHPQVAAPATSDTDNNDSMQEDNVSETQREDREEESNGEVKVTLFTALDFSKKAAPPVGTVAPIMQFPGMHKQWPTKPSLYKCIYCPYKTENKTNFDKHIKCHNMSNKYTCEWCNWSIDRLNLLYRHAQTVHPKQLAQQEKETFYGKVRVKGSPGKLCANHDDYDEDTEEYLDEVSDIREDEAAETKAPPTFKSRRSPFSSATERDLESQFLKQRRLSQGGMDEDITGIRNKRRRRLKTCTKCGYVTDNITTLQRHIAKHGSNGKFTCDFCDYSVDRQHIVEYHMKIVHLEGKEDVTAKVQIGELPERLTLQLDQQSEPDNSTEEEVETEQRMPGIGEDKISEAEDIDEEGEEIKQDLEDDEEEEEQEEEDGELLTEITKIRGQKMRVSRRGRKGKTIYGCLECPFTTANISNAGNHSKQHGAKKKYMCEYCDYSLDQLRHIMHHMKMWHSHGGATAAQDGIVRGRGRRNMAQNKKRSLNFSSKYGLRSRSRSRSQTSSQSRGRSSSSEHHLSAPVSHKRYHCHWCSFYTAWRGKLEKHKFNHRRFSFGHRCNICGHTALTRSLQQAHVRNVHGTGENTAGRRETRSSDRVGVRKPENSHNDLKMTLKTVGTCLKPVENHVEPLSFSRCKMCPFWCVHKQTLSLHKAFHIDSGKHKCGQCSYSVNSSFLLREHMLLHMWYRRCIQPHDL